VDKEETLKLLTLAIYLLNRSGKVFLDIVESWGKVKDAIEEARK
jgi:hypothetical protein